MQHNKNLLDINSLRVGIGDKEILLGVNLAIQPGEVHAIMGPNGSGKSTLAQTIMGHPSYTVESGSILFDGEDITTLEPHERSRKKIFLAFQYPYEIEGLSLRDLMRSAHNAWYGGTDHQMGVSSFHVYVRQKAAALGLPESIVDRSVNVGFSGGEKKQAEMLQIAILSPRLAILDEIDSGLDVDALGRVCAALQMVRQEHPEMSILLITHYNRILKHITPDKVHVMQKGIITKTGGPELAHTIEAEGYKE